MTDGLNNLLGTRKISRKFGDKEYTFSVIVLAEHAEKESYVTSLRGNPLEGLIRAVASLPPSMKEDRRSFRKMVDRLEDKCLKALSAPSFITRDVEEEFDNSLHGLAWSLWRALRDNHAEFGMVENSDSNVVWKSDAGREYTMTPKEGVQTCLDFMENTVGSERFKELFQIRDGVEAPSELGN